MNRSRTLLSLALAVLTALSAAGRAAADSKPVTEPNNTITINPLPLIVGMVALEYERKLSPNAALPIAVNYWSFTLGDLKFTSFGVGAGYRWYFHPVALDGWYLEPGVAVQSASITVTEPVTNLEAKASGVVFGPGVVFGREWVWESGFVLNLALGAEFNIGKLEAKAGSTSASADVDGVGFKGRFSLGYAWK